MSSPAPHRLDPVPAIGRKPRIALIGHLAGAQLFGAERSLLALAAAVDRTRYELSCVLPGNNEQYLAAIGRYTDSIHVQSYGWWSRSKPGDAASVARFVDLFHRLGVDLVHVNTITLLDPLLAARELGVPCIVHARELIDQDEALIRTLDDTPAAIIDRIRTAADFIIANSEITHRLYCIEGRSFRLYNCVETNALDLANKIGPGPLRVGIISTNQPRKGIEQFVELAILAARQGPALEFVVIGPHTAHTQDLAQFIQHEGVAANLHFAGYATDPVEAVSQVNVVMSLSIFAESFGRTLAEAMAARRPVIAYDRGAATEIVRHGIDGFIIAPGNMTQALTHLAMLADNPARVVAMGEAGRARVRQLFAPEVFAAGLHDIYRDILETWQRRTD